MNSQNGEYRLSYCISQVRAEGNLDCQRWSISCYGCISRSLLIAGLQGDAAAPPLLLRAGGPPFLPATSRRFLGGRLLRAWSCALFQEGEKVPGGRRDVARREGSHDCQELAHPRWTRRWAGGQRAGPAAPAQSRSQHIKALRAETQRFTSEPSSAPLKAALSPCSDPEQTFCHMLRVVHGEAV